MSTVYPPSDDVAAIRARIDHPIIDNDGHIIEYLPLVRDILVDLAGEDIAKRFDLVVDSGRLTQMLTADQRRELALARVPWWGIPTRNTLDRATAMLPQLLYQRLDQIGIDVAVVYPTYGLTAIHLADDELRGAVSRAFNTYVAEVYAPYRDRILPVACIPTFTPDEAVEELEFAVRGLGLRAVMMGGVIPRPYPGSDGPGRRAGWTGSVTRRRTTTRPCGRSASSSAWRRHSTRPARAGDRGRRRRTTCSTTSGTSPRPVS